MFKSWTQSMGLVLTFIVTLPCFARDCSDYLLAIDDISQVIQRRILVDDSQVEHIDVVMAKAIADVLTTITPYLGPLKTAKTKIMFRHLEDATAVVSPNDTSFDTVAYGLRGLEPKYAKILAAHEIGHEILDANFAKSGPFKYLYPKIEPKLDWMVLPYHELFAGMSVLLFTGGDTQIEADLMFKIIDDQEFAKVFVWDNPIALDTPVAGGRNTVYRLLQSSRYYLWKNYFKNAKRSDYARLMQVFIRAMERHLALRRARGEWAMATFTWVRRAALLNQEFVKLFDEEYARDVK